MSLIHLEKLPLGEAWRSRVEGHFILGAHPIETVRKGLPEAMAQAIVDHCAMSGEDVEQFIARLVREINALAPAAAEPMPALLGGHIADAAPAEPVQWTAETVAAEMGISPAAVTVKPRPARVPRKGAPPAKADGVVLGTVPTGTRGGDVLKALGMPVEPAAPPKEDI